MDEQTFNEGVDFWWNVIKEIENRPHLLMVWICFLLAIQGFFVIYFSIRSSIRFYIRHSNNNKRPFKSTILAFNGEVGSGKDTAASFLPYTHRFGFADPLKEMARIGFGFTQKQLHDPVEKEIVDPRWGASPRQILQWLGTDVLRARWSDFFTRNMGIRVDNAMKESSRPVLVVITDCRFPNEAEFVRFKSGQVIKVIREGGKRTAHHEHASEQGLPKEFVDYVIQNPSEYKVKENAKTLKEYETAVKTVYQQILTEKKDK